MLSIDLKQISTNHH